MGSAKTIRALLAATVAAFVCALPALAASGAQNPHLLVTLSAKVLGKAVQTVSVSGSVQNTTKSPLSVTITASLTGPLGNTGSNTSTQTLNPKQKLSNSYMYAVKPTDPRGKYTMSLSAAEGGKVSIATVSVTIK